MVVPIPNSKLSEQEANDLDKACEEAVAALKALGVRARLDARRNYTPGWKYAHWELKGVPLRCVAKERGGEGGRGGLRWK